MSHTRVRLSPDDRREQLLDLGVALLASRSLDELSIDLLAEEAGISRGLLYHYFRNKQEFHRAVVQRATEEMLELTLPDRSLDALTRLSTGLAAYVDYVEANYEPFLSIIRGAASGDRHLREIYQRARDTLTGRIVESLDELGIPETPATRLLVDGWVAMTEETVTRWVEQRPVEKAELLRLLTAALPALLGSAEAT